MDRCMIICYIVLCVWFSLFNGPLTHAYDVQITPENMYTSYTIGKTILCEARENGVPVALAGCQFMSQTLKKKSVMRSAILDFSNGSASEPQDGGSYQGSGLQQGQCGITLGKYEDDRVMGCRVREADGRWQYKTMLIEFTHWNEMNYTLEPSELLAQSGSRVHFNGTADRDLIHCFFTLPDDPVDSGKHESLDKHSTDRKGLLDQKICSHTIANVTVKDTGFVCGWASVNATKNGVRKCSTLIVLTPPDKPRLTVTSTNLIEGEMLLNATCVISNSRPVSNITWLLGDKVIREDLTNEGPAEAEWLWSYDPQSITQHLLRHVTQEDNDKQLVCRARHVALQSGRIDSSPYVIRVKHKPVFATSPAGELEGIEGKPLMIPVKATGNPSQITYRWTKDGLENVTVSEEPQLSFSQLGMYDAGVYTCTADNALGSTSVNIHITVKKDRTPYLMTEVLVPLLLVASAATLLWLKKLWCFAGGRDVDNYRMRLPLHTSDEE